MTEKRFTIKEFSTLDVMSSLDVICDNGIELPSSTACDLLNELSDENEQLKSYTGEMEDYLARLEEKNEQLKADKQALIDFIKKEFPKSHKHILEGFE